MTDALDRHALLDQLRGLLNRRGHVLDPTPDPGRFRVRGPGTPELIISPDNIFAVVLRDGDPTELDRWVEALLQGPGGLPPYLVARSGLRIALEPAKTEFAGALHSALTPALCEVLVYTDPAERRITWLSGASLDLWQASPADVEEVARANMDKLLATAELTVEEVRGSRLGLLSVDSVFKAALLRAPGLRALVEPELGWPVCAVAPCRDFLYLFPEADMERLIPLLAAIVNKEFDTSGYPLTTEVLRVSDEGLLALGAYGEP